MAVIIGRGGYVSDIARCLVRLETPTHTIRTAAAVDGPGEPERWETPCHAVHTARNPSIPCVQGDQDGLPSLLASTRHGWMPAPDLGRSPTRGGWLQSSADGRRSAAQ